MATFAMYYREPRRPSPRDQEIIEQITHLAGVVIARKLTLEALQRSEAYLAEAQKLSRTGSWTWSPVSRETPYWSEEMFRIYGLDPQQGPPRSETFWERVYPEERDSMRELMRKAAREKTEYEHDHRIVLPDGTVKYIHAIGHPVLNLAGDVVEFVGTAVDVTERKRAEEALRRSEAYLAEAQKLTKTGSMAWDPVNGNTVHCSSEIFRMFGLDPQRGIPAIAELLERVHPKDREYVTELSRKGAEDKAEHVVDYRLLLTDGILKYIHSIRHPVLNEAGEVVEFVGTMIDGTEQKRAEEEMRAAETRFRTSVDHLTDALFIHDDQDDRGTIVDVNQQACDSLGYTREELIGMTPSDYDARVDATFNLSIKERLARGEVFSFESAHKRKDGTVFPVEVRVRPF
jgi:PAS domain S-box-containing protein